MMILEYTNNLLILPSYQRINAFYFILCRIFRKAVPMRERAKGT